MFGKKLQILDITITIILFIIACFVGKTMMNIYDTWVAFNGSALGVLGLGELIWWLIREYIINKKWFNKRH